MNASMIDKPSLCSDRRFVVEAGNLDPAARHPHDPEGLIDHRVHTSRVAANRAVLHLLRRGLWVEVYDGHTRELLAGPFDPDQPAPAYIV